MEQLTENEAMAFASDCPSPDAPSQQREMQKQIWQAINKLDDKHREVIVLRHFRNMSYEQMAKALFCNKGTVTSRLYYARKELKEILERQKGGRH